jgi:hypothetical protein
MTIRTELETKITTMKIELAALEMELASGGTWLEKEWSALEAWMANLKAKVSTPPATPRA